MIFDLDGTLADLNGRKPYGEAQALCGDDLCREPIANMVRLYDQAKYLVIILSGRLERYRSETDRWLVKHSIPCDLLFMRPNELEQVPDTEIKEGIYLACIEPHFDVELVVDDRPKVIRMWRELGLVVADVGKGEEF